jgi:PAS domain S-box-containing protein
VTEKREEERRETEKSESAIAEEEALRGPFVAAAEQTRMPMVFSDPNIPNNPIVFANEAFLKMTGYDREEVVGRSYHFMMGECTAPGAREEIEAAFGEGYGAFPEVCYHRKDGSTFWAVIFIGTVPDEHGGVSKHFASFLDITRRKEDAERQRRLLDELNHRVKNTLATVQSIVLQSLRGSSVEVEVRDAIESRIAALGRAHDLLSREHWRGAELRSVIEHVLAPHGTGGDGPVALDGDDIRLPPKAALALALMFNELATNAAKYGALSSGGQIEVSWRLVREAEGERLKLRWREIGGPFVRPLDKRGLGSRMIERTLAQELRGTARIDFFPDGVVCEVDAPAPSIGED